MEQKKNNKKTNIEKNSSKSKVASKTTREITKPAKKETNKNIKTTSTKNKKTNTTTPKINKTVKNVEKKPKNIKEDNKKVEPVKVEKEDKKNPKPKNSNKGLLNIKNIKLPKIKLPKFKKENKKVLKKEKTSKKTDNKKINIKNSKIISSIRGIKLPSIKFSNKKSVITKDTKKQKNNKQPLFNAKTKKVFIITSIVCLAVILIEGIYLIYNHYEVEKKTVYYDSFNSLILDSNNTVAVGSSNFKHSKFNDYTKGLEKAKITKYDYNGKILFEKMYEKGINTTFSSIIAVSDGYIAAGSGEFSEEERTSGAREAILLKYDKDGKIVWEKFYQVLTNTRYNKVIAVEDGYIAIGQSIYANMEMGNHTTGGGIIVKYDKDGNEVWHNNHGGMKSGNFNDIVPVNGDLYVVGKDATDSGNIVKYNAEGIYQWHRNYSYTDSIGFTGIALMNNSLYVVGSKKVLPAGITDDDDRATTNTDALLVNYDLDGNIIFQKTFGGSNYERYNSILAYHNNLYVVGHTSSTDAGLKVDTDGNLMTGILVRYDKNGNITKKECFGGKNNDNLTDIVTDGVSIYVSAYSNSKDGNISIRRDNGKDYFGKIIKLDFRFRTLMIK